MKKVELFVLCCMCTLAYSTAQEVTPFEVTKTDGLKWVQEKVDPQGGSLYTGFTDMNGKRTLVGESKLMYDKSHLNICMRGQWKNDHSNGYVCLTHLSKNGDRMEYRGIVKNAVFEGYGQLYVQGCTLTAMFSSNKPIGLAFQEQGPRNFVGVVYTKGKENPEPAFEYFVKNMYESNKKHIQELCVASNVRYVEDMEWEDNTYSGGWKDGHPYFYGAYHYNTYGVKSVNMGYIFYDAKTKGICVENSYEEYFNDRSGKNYYRKLSVSNTDTTYSYFGTDCGEKRVIGEDGRIKEFDYVAASEYIHFLGYKDNKMWCYRVYDYSNSCGIVEGYMTIGDNIDVSTEKAVMTTGQTVTECAYGTIYSNPYNDSILVIEKEDGWGISWWRGKYYYSNGEYFIGTMRNGQPSSGKIFFADNELKQLIGSDDNSATESYNYVYDLLSSPSTGSGTYTYADGDVYTGEWNKHKPNGIGQMTKKENDKEILLKGEWSNGKLQRGIERTTYADGSYLEHSVGEDNNVEKSKRYYKILKETTDYTSIQLTNDGSKQLAIEQLGDYAIVSYSNGKRFVGKINLSGYNSEEYKLKFEQIDSCRITLENGIYDGAYSKDTPKQGIYTDNNKNSINGLFVCDCNSCIQPQGEAYINYADGSYYEGGVVEGKRNGNGVLTLSNGEKISSVWDDNQPSGTESTYTWPDGRKFVGTIAKGKLKKGKYYQVDGSEITNKKEYKTWTTSAYELEVFMPKKPKKPREVGIIGSLFNALFF